MRWVCHMGHLYGFVYCFKLYLYLCSCLRRLLHRYLKYTEVTDISVMTTTKKMVEAATMLNEDCWRAVLQYVPAQDIIRSETVSRRWQQMVLTYLSHIRIGIEYPDLRRNGQSTGFRREVHWLKLNEDYIRSFTSWTKKLGASLVAGYCTEDSFKAMGENCPNLEAVMFLELPEELLLNSQYENFTRLQQIRFENCDTVTDRCVNKFIGSNVLAALEFHRNLRVTGECLANIKSSNLKSLVFNDTYVEFPHFFAAVDHFGELRKLVLRGFKEENIDPDEIADQMLSMLEDRTPKLEYLDFYIDSDSDIFIDDLFWAICCLPGLRFLRVPYLPTEEEEAALEQFCPELSRFELTYPEPSQQYIIKGCIDCRGTEGAPRTGRYVTGCTARLAQERERYRLRQKERNKKRNKLYYHNLA